MFINHHLEIDHRLLNLEGEIFFSKRLLATFLIARPEIQARRERRPVHVVADEVEARVADVPFVVEHAVGVNVGAHAGPRVDGHQVRAVGRAVVEVARDLRVHMVLGIGRDRELRASEGRDDCLRRLPSRELVHTHERHIALRHTAVVELDEHGHIEPRRAGHHHRDAPQAPNQCDHHHRHDGRQPLPQGAPRPHPHRTSHPTTASQTVVGATNLD